MIVPPLDSLPNQVSSARRKEHAFANPNTLKHFQTSANPLALTALTSNTEKKLVPLAFTYREARMKSSSRDLKRLFGTQHVPLEENTESGCQNRYAACRS